MQNNQMIQILQYFPFYDLQGVPKNVLIECCGSHGAQAQSPVVGTTWAWKVFFGQRLSRIKCSQVMPMVKSNPTALNFGYDFVLLVHFLGQIV